MLACQYLESFRDNMREERWAPAASDALHLADMVAAIVLARRGLPVPGGHRGRLAMLRRGDHGLVRGWRGLSRLCLRGSRGVESGSPASVAGEVLRQCPSARAVLLYGSAARGEATGKSDVDILVLAGERCSVELGPPYSILVLTLEEWLGAREEFRREVLRDALVLYAEGIRLRELTAAEPWLLVSYTAKTPAARACASRAVARLEERGLLEKVARGVILAPDRLAARLLEALEDCGATIASSRTVLYRPRRLYCGRCPYCGHEVVAATREEAKKLLRKHLLHAHMDRLEEQARSLRGQGKKLPGGSLRGLAGFTAAYLVKEC